ncbi:MAG: hypothetical protein ACRDBG_22870, partial [Waterburya sp.]
MSKNRILTAFQNLLNSNRNLFNEAIYKLLGGVTQTYNCDLNTLMVKGYADNPDVNAIVNQMATKSVAVPYIIKPIDDKKAYQNLKRFPNNPTYLQTKKIDLLKKQAFKDNEQPMPIDRPNPNQTW